jgi:hypothetical protein
MATRNLMYVLPVAITALSFQVRAQQPLIDFHGCAILASVVRMEVIKARFGGSTEAYGKPNYSARDDIALCNQTARSATSAYTSALRRAGIHVTWGLHAGYSSDYCLSHLLAQCYPRGDPAMPALNKSDRTFVMRTWAAVYDSIASQMSLYPGSDVSRFRASELARRIRRAIDANHLGYTNLHWHRMLILNTWPHCMGCTWPQGNDENEQQIGLELSGISAASGRDQRIQH